MLSLNIIFLVIISLIALIVVVSIILTYKNISLNKILDIFYFTFPKKEYEFESCVTKYIDNNNDLDYFCKICESIGRKIKRSCYCFVVYNTTANFGNCKVNCKSDATNIWLIKYSLPDGTSIVEC